MKRRMRLDLKKNSIPKTAELNILSPEDIKAALAACSGPGPSLFIDAVLDRTFPWCFDRAEHGNLILNHRGLADADKVFETLLASVFSTIDPGRLRLMLIDPKNLGETFRSFRAFGETGIDRVSGATAKTRAEISAKMNQAVEWVGRVMETSLKDRHADIDDYNSQPGVVIQPYMFVCIAGFPQDFDQQACDTLERIMSKGPKCGVHVLMTWNRTMQLPHGFNAGRLESMGAAVTLGPEGRVLATNAAGADVYVPVLDAAPSIERLRNLVTAASRRADSTAQVVVDFDAMIEGVFEGKVEMGGRAERIISPGEPWSANSGPGLIAPLGQSGANGVQPLILGESDGIAFHGLLVGATGTGKSNALRVIIASLAMLYSPEELELYLLDFKDGVSFAPFADHKLPHVRVVGLKSDIELGRITMRAAVDEMTARNNLMARVGVDKISDYRLQIDRNGRPRKMSRIVLIFDEFQTMLIDSQESRGLANENFALLSELLTKGRSAGIHVILATQSIANAGAERVRDVMQHIAIRMLLRCAEKDSEFLLGPGNTEGTRLTGKGEMLFNDDYGAAGQTRKLKASLLDTQAWLPKMASLLRDRAERQGIAQQTVVFRGVEAPRMSEVLRFPPPTAATQRTARDQAVPLSIGVPLSLKPVETIRLRRRGGQNLLVVDRRPEQAAGQITGLLLTALASHAPSALSVDIHDRSEDDDWCAVAERIAVAFPEQVQLSGVDRELTQAQHGLQLTTLLGKTLRLIEAAEQRPSKERPTHLLVLTGMQRIAALRNRLGGGLRSRDEGAALPPELALTEVLTRGPDVGVHCILWVDSIGNLDGFHDWLRHCGWRSVGPGIEAETRRLLDNELPALAVNRSVLFDVEATTRHSVFRPFVLPSDDWLLETLHRIGTLDREK